MGVKCASELEIYAEITARRNVIVHNLGKIDHKYIREVNNPTLKVGDIVRIDRDYLLKALQTINKLAQEYATAVTLVTGHK